MVIDRPLGWLERSYISVNAVVLWVCEVQGARFDEQHLAKAVHKCIDRHANLRVNVNYNSEGEYCFKSVAEPYFSPDIIELSGKGEEEWQQFVHKEMNEKFDLGNDRRTLFKISVLHDPKRETNYLLIKYHHAIGDGVSGMIIAHNIMLFYTETRQDELRFELPRLMEAEKLSFPNGLTEKQLAQVEKMKIEILENRRNWTPTIPYDRDDSIAPRPNQNSALYYDGTNDNMKRIIEKCHQEKVTVGSVLLAAIYFATAKLSKQEREDNDVLDKFMFDLDVNLRDRYPERLGSDYVGLNIGMMKLEDIKLSLETKFWCLCKTINTQLKENLKEEKHLLFLIMSRLIDDLNDKQIALQLEKHHNHINDLNLSNIGRYPFSPEYGPWRLNRFYCVGSNWSPFYGTFNVLISSIHFLNYSLVYETSQFNEQIAKRWFKNFTNLTENSWKLADEFTLKQYLDEQFITLN